MEWRDEGVLISMRPHGESAAIIEVFTARHGRHAGVVRGGASRRMAATLQPGTQLAVAWRARLDGHLGVFTVEPLRSRAAVLSDGRALAGLGSSWNRPPSRAHAWRRAVACLWSSAASAARFLA
jgi:DNA repair protein RecO (recombination protein O)